MFITDYTKPTVMVIKKIILLSFIFLECACSTCSEQAEYERSQQWHIVIKTDPNDNYGRILEFDGLNLDTGRKKHFEINNSWFYRYVTQMSVGDTLRKNKGELVFSIHKPDTVLYFNWDCKGKIYR